MFDEQKGNLTNFLNDETIKKLHNPNPLTINWSSHNIEKVVNDYDWLNKINDFTNGCVYLCRQKTFWTQPYYHYYVLFNINNEIIKIEFHRIDLNFKVQISKGFMDINHKIHETKFQKSHHTNRILKVLGMTNYSLIYRNCEHVARYIFEGTWYCTQIQQIHKYIGRLFHHRWIDTFPEKLKIISYTKYNTNSPLTFHIKTSNLYLPKNENNIIIFGPIGAGKSKIINYLSKVKCCNSRREADGLIQLIEFIKCTNDYNNKTFNFIDTIGFTSSSWYEILFTIQRKINAISNISQAWFIINPTSGTHFDNIEAVSQCLKWLNSNKRIKLKLIFTHNKQNTDEIINEKMKYKKLINSFQHLNEDDDVIEMNLEDFDKDSDRLFELPGKLIASLANSSDYNI